MCRYTLKLDNLSFYVKWIIVLEYVGLFSLFLIVEPCSSHYCKLWCFKHMGKINS